MRRPVVQDGELSVSALVLSDAEELFSLIEQNHAHLRAFLPWVDAIRCLTDVSDYIEIRSSEYKNSCGGYFGIFVSNQLVGIISLQNFDEVNRSCAIGCWLSARACGKKIMTRVYGHMLKHVFENLDLNRVEHRCSPANISSVKLAEHFSFEMVGLIKQAEWLYDHFEDNVVYSLLRKNFRF